MRRLMNVLASGRIDLGVMVMVRAIQAQSHCSAVQAFEQALRLVGPACPFGYSPGAARRLVCERRPLPERCLRLCQPQLP